MSITTERVKLDVRTAAEIGMLPPGEHVIISLSDEGEGMAQEARERLFEPFSTTKEVGEGVELSLASGYGVIRQSDGEIVVESETGEGTTVCIYLPCRDEENA
jgi:two-component system, cell cycle sensor histidine kinase and response regulator CckA